MESSRTPSGSSPSNAPLVAATLTGVALLILAFSLAVNGLSTVAPPEGLNAGAGVVLMGTAVGAIGGGLLAWGWTRWWPFGRAPLVKSGAET